MAKMDKIGKLGENFVAEYLRKQNHIILASRWSCRWGEIDLITQLNETINTPCIAFVEVKTRQHRNWDEDGLLAITPQKQERLWQTAATFLSQNSELAELPCRFDVALVLYTISSSPPGYQFEIQSYLENAWG